MRRISLWHITSLLFVATLGLVWIYGSQLSRAYERLGGYIDGNAVVLLESSLYAEAIGLLHRGIDRDRARELLEQAVAIDPNSSAVYVLGDVLRMDGDREGALTAVVGEHAIQFDRHIRDKHARAERASGIGRSLEQGDDRADRRDRAVDGQPFCNRLPVRRPDRERRLPEDTAGYQNRPRGDHFEHQGFVLERAHDSDLAPGFCRRQYDALALDREQVAIAV